VQGIIHSIVALASSQLVSLLALDMGLSLRWDDLRREIGNPVLGRVLFVALVGVPVLAILVATTMPLAPTARGVIVLMAISPGAPMLMSRSQKSGNAALAVALAVALTLAAPVFVPVEVAVLNRLFPWRLQASSSALLYGLVPKLLLPLALGVIARRVWRGGAVAIEPFVRKLFHLAFLIVVVGALAISWREIVRMSPWAWLAMLLVTLGAALFGDAVGGRDPRNRATAAYAVVLGNPAIAMTVAALSYPWLHAVPIIVAYAVLRAIFILPYAVVSSRRLALRDAPMHSPR
jgi:BASS family bile acid:Na+ symporter